MPPFEARRGDARVSGAVIPSCWCCAAVFVPVAFLGGIAGQLSAVRGHADDLGVDLRLSWR